MSVNNGFFGEQGQYIYDQAERTMIHRILKQCVFMKKSNDSYAIAYDFLESDWGGLLYEKFYDHFKEFGMDFMGPLNIKKTYLFDRVAKSAYSRWKSGSPVDEKHLNKFYH